MDIIFIITLLIEIIICLSIIKIIDVAYNKLKQTDNRIFNLKEYFPEEEIHVLRQLSYLILLTGLFIDILYMLIINTTEIPLLTIFDVCLSIFCCVNLKEDKWKNWILILALLPLALLQDTLLNIETLPVLILYVIHILALIYAMKKYYSKFIKYTTINGLGWSILLLFSIIFISTFVTSITEHVSILDAINMVSNAFTSNGYVVLGSSIIGKIDDVILVWSGYILSGVSSATLCAAILIRYMNSRFKELETLIKEQKEEKE